MKIRKSTLTIAVVGLATFTTIGIQSLYAQQPGFTRTELQKHDTSIQGREVVQARADFMPGGGVGKHTHPGEEIGYVLAGTLVLEVEGKPPVTLKAGEVFFIPAGVVHAGRNPADAPGAVISTYVVEKGKPLATLVK